MKSLPSLPSLLLAALAALPALAGDDIDLATACLDCHRAGQPRGEVPLIEGQQRDYLQNQLARFRDRHRDGFPMSALSAGIGDASAAQMADALAQRPWRAASGSPDFDATNRGRQRAIDLACSSCHGADFLGSGDVPRLAGQQAGYLSRQLLEFGDGERFHPPTGVGSRMYALDAEDARAIAAFLHSLDSATVDPAGN
jgi:cytochrome c553